MTRGTFYLRSYLVLKKSQFLWDSLPKRISFVGCNGNIIKGGGYDFSKIFSLKIWSNIVGLSFHYLVGLSICNSVFFQMLYNHQLFTFYFCNQVILNCTTLLTQVSIIGMTWIPVILKFAVFINSHKVILCMSEF